MKNLKARRDDLAEGKYPLEVVPPTYIRQQIENRYHFVHGFDTAVAELMPEMEELVKALEFCANEKSWLKDEMFGWHICGEHKIYYWGTEYGVEHDIESREDTGDKARAALTGFKEFMGNNESKQITVFEMEAKNGNYNR